MRAAVISNPKTIAIQSVRRPIPGPHEVRVQLEGCGVCGSNLPVWEGRPWFSYPFDPGSPGHEGWGIVDAVGTEVENVLPGDRVALLSYNAFAEFDLATADSLAHLPDSLNELPCPGEPLACAMNVFRRSQIDPGMTVAIVGIGFLGALLTNLAVRAGARVIAISRRSSALDFATKTGAHHALRLDEKFKIVEQVNELTGGSLCDVTIEATGFSEPLNLAGELTKIRGRLVIAGYHQDGTREVNMQLWNWRGLDVINAHERDPARYIEGLRKALAAIGSGELDPRPFLTHQFPLENIEEAFHCMHDRPDDFLKASIIFS